MQILALDVGSVRIGVAIGSSEIGIAHARDFLPASNKIFEEIRKICTAEKVEKIVVGEPKNLAGGSSAQTDFTVEFVKNLREKVDCEVSAIDERFSSVAAERNLSAGGIKAKNQRHLIDSEAARIFLQDYLDQQA